MRRPSLPTILAILTAGIGLLDALGPDRGVRGAAAVGHAIGTAATPWLLGALAAATIAVWRRIRRRPQHVRPTFLASTAAATAIVLASTAFVAARATDGGIRGDAIEVLGAAALVPATAAYCETTAGGTPEMRLALTEWNRRNRADQEKTAAILRATGDMTRREKDALRAATLRMARDAVEDEADKPLYCRSFATMARNGGLDLSRIPDLSAPLGRVRAWSAP